MLATTVKVFSQLAPPTLVPRYSLWNNSRKVSPFQIPCWLPAKTFSFGIYGTETFGLLFVLRVGGINFLIDPPCY